jgi:lipopolysaccharide export LptBFGC system permease protein LptF
MYEFDNEGVHLARVVIAESGEKNSDGLKFSGVKIITLNSPHGRLTQVRTENLAILEPTSAEIFTFQLKRPSELNSIQLSTYIKQLKIASPTSNDLPLYQIARWRKGVDPLSPLIMWLNGVPLAISFGKRSTMAALGVAVLIGLAYWVGGSVFQQLGVYRLIPAAAAALSLPALFTLLGFFIFSRVRT